VDISIHRVQFLRGDFNSRHRGVHPPWSVDDAHFFGLCNRCGDCTKACPTRIIGSGSGNFPAIDFSRGQCTFCGDCVKACQTGALSFPDDPATPPWSLEIEIDPSCLSLSAVVCRSCGDICEEQAIRFRLQTGGRSVPRPDPTACTGCGACVAVCPSHSIKITPTTNDHAALNTACEEILNR
jgi:ferredoxin-type protein NapF